MEFYNKNNNVLANDDQTNQELAISYNNMGALIYNLI